MHEIWVEVGGLGYAANSQQVASDNCVSIRTVAFLEEGGGGVVVAQLVGAIRGTSRKIESRLGQCISKLA
jgi:hypothetical protein